MIEWICAISTMYNKVGLLMGELTGKKAWFLSAWWVMGIVAIPTWIILFIWKQNWIAASVESTVILPIAMAIINVNREGKKKAPYALQIAAKLTIALGLVISIYDFGGLVNVTQLLELGIAATFLLGTYFLALDTLAMKRWGYGMYMALAIITAVLMAKQSYWIMFWQQILSLGFVWYSGVLVNRRMKV